MSFTQCGRASLLSREVGRDDQRERALRSASGAISGGAGPVSASERRHTAGAHLGGPTRDRAVRVDGSAGRLRPLPKCAIVTH